MSMLRTRSPHAAIPLGLGVCCVLPAQGQWQPLPAFPQPEAVGSPGLAYDAAHQNVVLFGGDSNTGLHESTWTWDGSVWTQRLPASHPSARTMAGTACDAARQRIVLFGGFSEAGGVAIDRHDTWEWDGANWTERFPAHAPSARGAVAITYDALRQRVVLFGGGLGGFMMPTFGDTWEWDGIDWTQRLPAHSPPSSRSGALVFDSQRGVSVLFGGLPQNYVKLDGTWEWNGVDWTQRFPAHAPSPRFAHGMAYDSTRHRTVLFGGGTDLGETADTWQYDGIDWTLLAPANPPSGRAYQALAYDPLRQRMVMRGSRRAETWEYAATSPAAYATFGTGCAGWAGTPWLTANSNRPLLGQPFTVFVYNLPPDHSTLLWIGLSNTNWLGVPLPLPLAPLGATGCSLLASPDATYTLFNWAGYATWTWTVPNQPALAGLHFYNQAAAIDHGNALGLVFTNGGDGTLGDH